MALLKKGFDELEVEEVYSVTMKKNLGSKKVMEKIGLNFKREFYHPDYPGTTDLDVEYSVLKIDWLSRL